MNVPTELRSNVDAPDKNYRSPDAPSAGRAVRCVIDSGNARSVHVPSAERRNYSRFVGRVNFVRRSASRSPVVQHRKALIRLASKPELMVVRLSLDQ